jgi:hypothetical protein
MRVCTSHEKERKMWNAMRYNNNNKRLQYVLPHALLLSNTKDDRSRNLMTSFNWQKNDVERGSKREKRRSIEEREKKDKPSHSVRCNADTDEAVDKKNNFKKKII